MQDLRDRVAVVTGAASGIGRGMARALVEEGAKVVLADVEAAPLEETAAEMRASGGDVQPVCCDVSDAAAMDHLRDETLNAFGAVPRSAMFRPRRPLHCCKAREQPRTH